MLHTFGTLKLDREYSETDLKRLVPIGRYGLDAGWYGGRCTHIGETDSDVLLIYDNNQDAGKRIIDLGAEDLTNIPPRFIKQLLDSRKITYSKTEPKTELIAKLSQ
jgi:hypothetical protein